MKPLTESQGWSNFNWLALSVAIFAGDQLTKYAAVSFLAAYQPWDILPFFNLTLAFNSGAAFSFLSDAGGWQRWFFVAIAAILVSVLLTWLYQLPKGDRLSAAAISAIIGGALGNVSDRLTRGYVVDFLDFHLYNYHWPVFNIADVAISLGVAVYVWILLLRK